MSRKRRAGPGFTVGKKVVQKIGGAGAIAFTGGSHQCRRLCVEVDVVYREIDASERTVLLIRQDPGGDRIAQDLHAALAELDGRLAQRDDGNIVLSDRLLADDQTMGAARIEDRTATAPTPSPAPGRSRDRRRN